MQKVASNIQENWVKIVSEIPKSCLKHADFLYKSRRNVTLKIQERFKDTEYSDEDATFS